jgi:hypothetical protein
MRFWGSGFPWNAIDSCIANESLEFAGTTHAQELFTRHTGLAWDSLHDPTKTIIPCAKCKQQMASPWTTSGNYSSWSVNSGELGDGFADKNFRLRCPSCQEEFDHDVLRACKFRRDVEQLLLNDTPMPGTILNSAGKVTPLVFIVTAANA